MVKLIRIASDNNGIFRSNFQNDIIVEPQSKLALLNATFQTGFNILTINDSNNKITFNYDTKNSTNFDRTISIKPRNYTNNDVSQLFKDLEFGLNSSIFMGNSGVTSNLNIGNSVQFKIREIGGRKRIEFRYSPFLNALYLPGPDGSGTDLTKSLFNYIDTDGSVSAIEVINTGIPNFLTSISKFDSQSATSDRTCKMTTSLSRLCQGNGLITLRINNSVDNGSGFQDNGIGMGITYDQKLGDTAPYGQDIPVEARDLEIRYNRPTETYVYIQSSSGTVYERDSSVIPLNVAGGDLVDHDTIFFRSYNGKIEGGVFQNNNLGYLNLPEGNNWTQSPTPTTEIFDEINLGPIATYRRTQTGTTVEHWFEATSATNWNVYFSGPPIFGQTVDATVVADLATGVLTFGGGITFTPSTIPTVTENVRKTKTFFTEFYEPGTEFYPYLYIRGAKTDITADCFNMSIDPWVNQDFTTSADGDEIPYWDTTGLDGAGNQHNGFNNSIRSMAGVDALLEDVPLPDETAWSEKKNARLTLNSDIWRFLGFQDIGSGDISKDISMGIGFNLNCWSWYLAQNSPKITLSDNFIVESLSLQLDSYDASKIYYSGGGGYFSNESAKQGRRKNILMTIPKNDNNSNGLVEYEVSNPIFIDINNASILNQKSLDFQILTKDFQPIDQSGETAILTLLVKGPNE